MDGSQFTNHVVISLKDFMDMSGEIERLKIEKADINRKYENLKKFLYESNLPAEIIADGQVKNMDFKINLDDLHREVTYLIKVTVSEGDLKKYGY